MPSKAILRANAQERLEDARALFEKGRFDGAAYLCGYAVEFALKARICDTLDIEDYPEHLKGFKIHDLEDLRLLSGRSKAILGEPEHAKLWSKVFQK